LKVILYQRRKKHSRLKDEVARTLDTAVAAAADRF